MAHSNSMTQADKGRKAPILSQILTVALFAILQLPAAGQTILVNPDGTHSVILNAGSSMPLMVNPDGTHTVIFNNGSTQTWVNPNGTHSVMLNADTNTPILINPDGTHSVILNAQSNTPVMVNPNGTHTQIIKSENTQIHLHPDGKSSPFYISEPPVNEKTLSAPKAKKKSRLKK
jgi:hypothetical protein